MRDFPLHLDKVAATWQMAFKIYIFLNENYCILIQFLLKFVTKDPVDHNFAVSGNGLLLNRSQAITWPIGEPAVLTVTTKLALCCQWQQSWHRDDFWLLKRMVLWFCWFWETVPNYRPLLLPNHISHDSVWQIKYLRKSLRWLTRTM